MDYKKLGKAGGSARSPAKIKASQENGRLGGRPNVKKTIVASIPDQLRSDFNIKTIDATFPISSESKEIGGLLFLVDQELTAIEVANQSRSRWHYLPDFDAIPQEWQNREVLGIWHTHLDDRGPTAPDRRAAEAWFEIEGVPVFVVVCTPSERVHWLLALA